MILRPEQKIIVDQAKEILANYGIVYIAAELRTGKTIMSLSVAHESTARTYNHVLFVTKKKVIDSIEKDYAKCGFKFDIFKVINFEQLEKQQGPWDLIIVDEAHSLGKVARPSLRAKEIKRLSPGANFILLSGTPTPENFSQIYHQLWATGHSPFPEINFYKWAKNGYVKIKKRFINGIEFNDYTGGIEELIKPKIAHLMLTLSQEQAGFTSFVDEEILRVPMSQKIYNLMEVLKRDKVYVNKEKNITIVADTPVRLQSIFHQLSSGTIKIEDKRMILDRSKAEFIKERFAGQHIAIFYKFIQEALMLQQAFPQFVITPDEFNTGKGPYLSQFLSGREGVNLSSADALVMFNIDFSATTYWQARGRLQVKERTKASKIYWIMSDRGIELDIYKAVQNKKNYTIDYFKKSLQKWNPNYSLAL